jgi:TetR/AcrR family fatty acid metabolism transcriptional regulator
LEDKAQRLMRATLDVVGERGYAQATVRDIAERAGMAAGTFYLYFPAKEAAGVAIIDRVYQEVLRRARESRAGLRGPAEKLLASARAVLSVLGKDPQAARFVFWLAPGAHPAFDRRLAQVHGELLELVREDVAQILGAGEAADRVSEALVGAVAEVATSWVRRGAPDGELERAGEILARVFGTALAAWGREGA